MAGILSYIRTVGSRALIEKVESFIEKIELGEFTLSEALNLLQSISLAYLPSYIRNKLLAALSALKEQTYRELKEREGRAKQQALSKSEQAQMTELQNNYHNLVSIMHSNAIFFSDVKKHEKYVERINDAFNDTYKPVDDTGIMFQNEHGEVLVHLYDTNAINPDPINQIYSALDLISSRPDGIRHELMQQVERGTVQIASGKVPEFNNFESCKAFAKDCGFEIAQYCKLKPIPTGCQREHLLPHSCIYAEYKAKGQSRANVSTVKTMGKLTEANALCIYVDDAQKIGTQHKMLTDADRDFAKALKQAEGGEIYRTVNDWLDNKEKALAQMAEAEHMKQPPSQSVPNRLNSESGAKRSIMARFAAHSMIQATKIHMTNLGADLNTRASNRIAFGSIPPENLSK